MPDDTVIFGVDGDDGRRHWVHQDGDRLADVRELGWDEQGYPDIPAEDEFVDADQYAKTGELGGQDFGGLTAKDVGVAAADAGNNFNFSNAERVAAKEGGRAADAAALGKAARVGGAASSGATVAATTASDIQGGMDPTKAVVSNAAGGAASYATTSLAVAGLAFFAVPVGARALGLIAIGSAAVGVATTKGIQRAWK
ncbi:hypothetical protein LH392_09455 [Corynebacterium uberis]|uniref:hypothetical protein n=2 Tax=Corynebacterium TaxID=1716 RepID=UPI001D0AD805|nr:hypothetical protein [Corynebacterium uberis]UDL73731.1 hypothetical protein LH391_00365 [Corynebacterium uberis]UDL75386.1 hypothetical protein LH393_09040 [Corynebacterium uberis]UDL77598.1 hypothetical protein LH394_09025 [Corynebacterium uberis]UDL79884.1 hypothetical protein LH392_09455 [Corynebacterium uberis]UDL82014.1 hypothetical protein LH395_09030 [Corynebacterium uberis]